jgi:biopolymer transport protein ExbB
MLERLAGHFVALWHGGGVVMPALFATAFVLWFALGERALLLRRGDARPVRALLAAAREGRLGATRGIVDEAAARCAALAPGPAGAALADEVDEVLAELRERLRWGTRLVPCLVSVAPLLGLLGTVTGLIETFGSLGSAATSTASEGIAGGIVEALYATQVGLAVAVPGLLAEGVLRQRQSRLAADLDQSQALACGALAGAGT